MIVASLDVPGVMAAIRARVAAPRECDRRAGIVTSVFHSSAPITGRDWLGLAGLGVVGQCFYRSCFIGGLAQTSVANSALLARARRRC